MARLSHSTTRLFMPLSRDLCVALLNSLRFHLKLYGMARPMASYSVAAVGKLMEGSTSRNGARGGTAQLLIRAARGKLHITLRLPAGVLAPSRLKALLPAAPPGIQVRLKSLKSGPQVIWVAPIPGQD